MVFIIVILRLRYFIRLFCGDRILGKFAMLLHHSRKFTLQILNRHSLRNFACLFSRCVSRYTSKMDKAIDPRENNDNRETRKDDRQKIQSTQLGC